jgi:hypothetical protein
MRRVDAIDDPRRRLLMEALTAGFALAGLGPARALADSLFGNIPGKLPPGQSIFRLTGTASVNGTPATLRTQVRPGDTIETGEDSELIFVVGGNSMLVRAKSRLTIEGAGSTAMSLFLTALRLIQGKVLQVSRHVPMRVTTPTATIGIRGTGFYAEAAPDETYFCTCYGLTDVTAANDPASSVTVHATHHNRPLYVLGGAAAGRSIRNAPFINHTDQELELIEALVGRAPPFVFPKNDYLGPRRGY